MTLFVEISILLAIATLMGLFMKKLKQPLLIGHIITGIIVGPIVLSLITSTETLHLFSEMGIAILLFIVGLHLKPSVMKKFGKVSLITGFGQVAVTSVAGFFISRWIGIEILPAIYVGIALAFSSTIIIMKLVADKGDMESLYGKISIGFLLVQDIIAILLLFFIPIVASGDLGFDAILILVVKSSIAFGGIFLFSKKFLPAILNYVGKSQELLFLFTISWGLGVATLFKVFGFSIESGALIAGIALASLPVRDEISARLTPLRDFFIVAFFILLGAQMEISNIGSLIGPALALSSLVLIGNPLILMSIMGLLGYKKKTSLQTGFTVAQISEFSLILIALGLKFGHVDQYIVSLVTLVGLITIFGSTYLILYSDKIYNIIQKYLSIFEKKKAKEDDVTEESYEVILFGVNRIGHTFLDKITYSNYSLMAIDYNPDVVKKLEERGVAARLGDASDINFLENLPLKSAKIVISTIPNIETNKLIFDRLYSVNENAVSIAVATKIQEALDLYGEGLDYVILPHFLGAQHAAEVVMNLKSNRSAYKEIQVKHRENLNLHIEAGHEHP
ncbi:MAG: Kef-type K+ transport system membrane component KefB [Candidatus Paceibacteria bacterium]|jgi:Kef-type K+ transport system membrane component KefB